SPRASASATPRSANAAPIAASPPIRPSPPRAGSTASTTGGHSNSSPSTPAGCRWRAWRAIICRSWRSSGWSRGGRNFSHVRRPRPNELSKGVLLDRMADPAEGAAEGEEGQRRVRREIEGASQGYEAEVDRRVLADQIAAGFGEGQGAFDGGGAGGGLGGDLQEGGAAGIAVGVERVATAGDLLAALEAVRQDSPGVGGRSRLAEERFHALRHTAMAGALESGKARGDDIVGRRGGRGHAAGGESRDVQLVVRREDERRRDRTRRLRTPRCPARLENVRDAAGWRIGDSRRNRRQETQDTGSRHGKRRGSQVPRRQVGSARQRKRHLAALNRRQTPAEDRARPGGQD